MMDNDIIDNDTELNMLCRSLNKSTKFSLFLAQYNTAQLRDNLLAKLKEQLSATGVTLFIHHLKGPVGSLNDFIPPELEPSGKEKIVLAITGLENSYPTIDDSNNFWHRLNYSRDLFPQKFPFPLVFWLMEGTFKKILEEAHDFWSWRSGTFYFSIPVPPLATPQGQFNKTGLFQEEKKEKAISRHYFKAQYTRLTHSLDDLMAEPDTEMNRQLKADIFQQLGSLHLSYAAALKKPARKKELLENALNFQLQSVAIKEKLFSEIHMEIAAGYVGLAVIYSEMWALEKSLEYELKAKKIYDVLFEKPNLEVAESYNRLGRLHFLMGQKTEALICLEKMETIYEALGSRTELAETYGFHAQILQDVGRLDEAMSLHKKEEKICVVLGDQEGLARTYGNQALILQDWGRLDEAMKLLKKQEEIFESLGNRAALSNSLWNQGLIYSKRGDYQTQIVLWKKSIEIDKAIGVPTYENEKELNALMAKFSA